MDATRLIDPAFWSNPQPLALGDSEVTSWCGGIEALEGHVLFQTSGSSGTPKWIALSKVALQLSAAAVNRHLEVTDNSVWGLTLPLHHVGGFGVAARAFEAACQLETFSGKWEAVRFGEWCGAVGVTHVSLVPTQVFDLVQAGLEAPSSLRVIVVGGGRLEEALGRAARALGWPVLASYGMTEAGSQIATQPPELLGEPYVISPLPVIDIWRVCNDQEGRLMIAGPALFSGSVNVGGSAPRWCPRITEWHATGDRVRIEERGLTPMARMDALVKVLGELVDPEAIERELLRLSNGALTAGTFVVVAVPDERAGNRLVPVFEEGVPKDLVERILSIYARGAPGFCRLAAAVSLRAIPKSELGKIHRGAVLSFLAD